MTGEPPSSPEASLSAATLSLPEAPSSTGVPRSKKILLTSNIPDVLPKGVTHQARKNAYAAALNIFQGQLAAYHTELSVSTIASTYHGANTITGSGTGHIHYHFHNGRIGKIAPDCFGNPLSYYYKEGVTKVPPVQHHQDFVRLNGHRPQISLVGIG